MDYLKKKHDNALQSLNRKYPFEMKFVGQAFSQVKIKTPLISQKRKTTQTQWICGSSYNSTVRNKYNVRKQ